MHAVVFLVDVKQAWDGDVDQELDQIATMTKSLPGFIRGTWTTNGRQGLSFILFETEAAARGLADNASLPPTAGVSLRSVDVYEVVREA